ncbi:MAG: PA14 domain-containing protein, partial [Acidimicrobiales bacterium]|nr:PA14 domain-containing protein [Acidimicrobiales bacterium]
MNDLKSGRLIRNLAMMGLIGIAVLLPVFPAAATNWQANIKPGSDIVMNDLRWPEWDAGTYYCFWYMSFYPKYSSLYGGVAVHGPDKTPGMFTSYWCVTEAVYEGPEFYGKGFGAEGSKGGANGAPSFQRPNSWYRMVMRTFPPTRGGEGKTNVGWWVKDVEQNKWYTHSVLRIRKAVTGFQANSGFVEALAPESTPRAFERRFGYCRLNGEWHDSPLSANDDRKFKLIENDTVVRFDRSGPDGGAKKESTFYPTRQPAAPTLDKPAINHAEAHGWGNQVNVKWEIPQNASPQLGYKIEAFAGREALGQPLATWEDASPHIINKRLDTTVPAKSVRLTVTDIFDQQIAVVIPVKNTTLPAPAVSGATRTRAGLGYVYYEDPNGETWTKLPDFSALKPAKRGYVKTLDDTVREDRSTGYAIRYKGYVQAPVDGLYVISAGTSDGSRLYVDGKLIAKNDGMHSTSQKLYSLPLSKGLHPFELDYFKGADNANSRQSTTAKIAISLEGPGFEMRKLTREDFRCDDRTAYPSATLVLTSAVSAGVLQDNMANIQVGIERRKQSIQKLQLFAGKVLLTTKLGSDVDDMGKVDISVLLPEGRNQIWARLWFGEGASVDSANELELEARNRIAEPWQFNSMLEGGFPLAVRGETDSVSFMGEGFGFVHQTVAGDFTLTARIADMPLTSKENGLWPSNWLGLSVMSKHANPRVLLTDKSPYHSEISLFLTAEGKMRAAKDFPDLAGSNMSIASFEGDHRWLRLVRRGRRYQSFTSADGTAWELADERFTSHPTKEAYAGVCFRSGPNKSRSLFQGKVDHLKLENSTPQELRERPRKEDLRLENRVTALVQAPKNPGILYARSVGKGLLKSHDRGKTWAAVNSGITTPDAMAVRSVAVHPKNSSIVLRAGGSVVGGELKSGLWRSKDGGQSWKLVTSEIDFDGRGPTTLFGEVMLFCPQDPNLVVA